MYLSLDGIPSDQSHDHYCLHLQPLEKLHWVGLDDETVGYYLQEEYPAWYSSSYFAFGCTVSGDKLTYCLNPPGRQPGSIVMLDHGEAGPAGNPDQPGVIVFHGESLAQWLKRWIALDFYEYGYMTGEAGRLPDEQRKALFATHTRLNPGIRVPDNCA